MSVEPLTLNTSVLPSKSLNDALSTMFCNLAAVTVSVVPNACPFTIGDAIILLSVLI